MPTATEFLTQVRDEAFINTVALTAVRAQLLERVEALEDMNPGPVRQKMAARFARALQGLDEFLTAERNLQTAANEGIGALGGTIPPLPPPPTGGIVWSTDEW